MLFVAAPLKQFVQGDHSHVDIRTVCEVHRLTPRIKLELVFLSAAETNEDTNKDANQNSLTVAIIYIVINIRFSYNFNNAIRFIFL